MARARVLPVAFVWLACAACARAADVHVAFAREPGGVAIDAVARIDADVATAWRVLTDYERYPEFLADVERCRVVAREGARVTVVQTVAARAWLPWDRVDAVYDIRESPPDSLDARGRAPLGAIDGRYRLQPVDGGVRLRYVGSVAVAAGWLAPLRRMAAERAATADFRALADAIEAEGRRARGVR